MVDIEELPARVVLAMALSEKARRKSENKLADFKPYEKQLEFYAATANVDLREFL
jgi:phage terminase large subunit-like protein